MVRAETPLRLLTRWGHGDLGRVGDEEVDVVAFPVELGVKGEPAVSALGGVLVPVACPA
jgi:hypothetical protein